MLFSFANTLYYYKNACIKMLLIWCKGKVIPSHGESSVSLTHPQFPHLFIYLLIWSFHICIWIYQSCYLKQHFHKNCFCHFFADTFFFVYQMSSPVFYINIILHGHQIFDVKSELVLWLEESGFGLKSCAWLGVGWSLRSCA